MDYVTRDVRKTVFINWWWKIRSSCIIFLWKNIIIICALHPPADPATTSVHGPWRVSAANTWVQTLLPMSSDTQATQVTTMMICVVQSHMGVQTPHGHNHNTHQDDDPHVLRYKVSTWLGSIVQLRGSSHAVRSRVLPCSGQLKNNWTLTSICSSLIDKRHIL